MAKETCRLDVLVKDYEVIRAEAIYRLGSRERLAAFFVPVVGLLVAAAFKANEPTKALVLAFAVPFVCFETVYLWLSETQALRRASKYLCALSGPIQKEVEQHDGRNEPPVLTWEQQLRESVPAAERQSYYLRHYILNTLLFWMPAMVFGAVGCYLIWLSGSCTGKLSIIAEVVGFAIAAYAFFRKTMQIIALYQTDDPRNPDTV